jgi:hypothetical protein
MRRIDAFRHGAAGRRLRGSVDDAPRDPPGELASGKISDRLSPAEQFRITGFAVADALSLMQLTFTTVWGRSEFTQSRSQQGLTGCRQSSADCL